MKVRYKMNRRKLTFLISLLACLLLIPLTQTAPIENDPTVDPTANACFEGGTLYEACQNMDVDEDGDFDQLDRDWLWTCGWYLIRVETGMFSADVLDGICEDIVEIVVVQKDEKDDKKKDKDDDEVEVEEEGEEESEEPGPPEIEDGPPLGEEVDCEEEPDSLDC